MIKGCLIGDPVSGSISHITHNAVLKHLNIPGVYSKLQVKEEDLVGTIQKLKKQNLQWLGVTMPFKQTIIPYLDFLRESAHILHAVNTIIVKDGKWIGENYDGHGCLNAIESKRSVKGLRVLVVGAGGTAKAIIYEAKLRGANVFVWNRTQIRAESICIDFKVKCLYVLEGKFDIVINATSVGMNSNTLSIPVTILKGAKTVMDVVYSPLETVLLKTAKSFGCEIISGLEMFLELSALQLFQSLKPPITHDQMIKIMREAALDSYLNKV